MFQQVREILGQKDDKGYQKKLEITASVVRVKDVEYSKSSGKPGQSLLLKCGGEEEWVKFQGGKDFTPLDPSAVGKTYIFLVWPFRPDQSPKTYLYCWIQRQVPQNGQQPPQQAAQSTNSPSGGNEQDRYIQSLERIATALEKIAGNGQGFEQKYNIPPEEQPY